MTFSMSAGIHFRKLNIFACLQLIVSSEEQENFKTESIRSEEQASHLVV